MKKEYTADFQLGIVTDTWDTEGAVVAEKEVVDIKPECLQILLDDMVGIFEQQPPIFSAKKIRGKPSYYYARSKRYENSDIVLKPAPVKIYSIDLLSFDGIKARIRVECSAGTYIRSIVHEIGNRLNCGATLTGLVRNKIDGFKLDDAIGIDMIEKIRKNINFDSFKKSIISSDKILNADFLKI